MRRKGIVNWLQSGRSELGELTGSVQEHEAPIRKWRSRTVGRVAGSPAAQTIANLKRSAIKLQRREQVSRWRRSRFARSAFDGSAHSPASECWLPSSARLLREQTGANSASR
eukprot:1453722-Pleurochrysis_carterae.AAC.4